MIQGISSTDQIFGSTDPLAPKQLDKNAFMELLVSQLRNQDPLEPASNEEFVAQLATFSSLEQLENLNEGILTMALLQQSNALLSQLTEGSALIGQVVKWTDRASGQELEGTVESVKVVDGTAFLRIGGQDVPLIDLMEVLGSDGGADESDD